MSVHKKKTHFTEVYQCLRIFQFAKWLKQGLSPNIFCGSWKSREDYPVFIPGEKSS